jgi:hypothetical protein
MLTSVLNAFFGCAHRRTTFPLTIARRAGATNGGKTYVTCLDCGKEFDYNWSEMKVGAPVNQSQRPSIVPQTATTSTLHVH